MLEGCSQWQGWDHSLDLEAELGFFLTTLTDAVLAGARKDRVFTSLRFPKYLIQQASPACFSGTLSHCSFPFRALVCFGQVH